MSDYSKEDVIKSYRWLGHTGYWTELAAFHPEYKAGKENYPYNLKNRFMPRIWYARTETQVLEFLNKFHSTNTCCYGVNPRQSILKNKNNYVRSAVDADIEVVKNFYLDFDLIHGSNDSIDMELTEELIRDIIFYLGKEKIDKPACAFTGNGYHLLFALPSIIVIQHPDIKDRMKKFRDIVDYEFSNNMKECNIRLDSTVDLRRMAKIYGTRKPYKNSKLSRFYGEERVEDYVLRDYLLSLEIDEELDEETSLDVVVELPEKFKLLLGNNSFIQGLWNNEGKKETSDDSRSGYDFTLVKECIKQGITDINDLIAILSLRPEGAFQKSGKNKEYIKRTVGNAIYK
jgi:predicted DNA-binding protein